MTKGEVEPNANVNDATGSSEVSKPSFRIKFHGQEYDKRQLPPKLLAMIERYPELEPVNGTYISQYTDEYSDHTDVAHSVVKNIVWAVLTPKGAGHEPNMIPTPEPIVCLGDKD